MNKSEIRVFILAKKQDTQELLGGRDGWREEERKGCFHRNHFHLEVCVKCMQGSLADPPMRISSELLLRENVRGLIRIKQ